MAVRARKMGRKSHARIDSRLDALLQRAQRLRSEYEDSAASSEPSTDRVARAAGLTDIKLATLGVAR